MQGLWRDFFLLLFWKEMLKICVYVSSLSPPSENLTALWKNNHMVLSDCRFSIYYQAINDSGLATALLASLPSFYRGKTKEERWVYSETGNKL